MLFRKFSLGRVLFEKIPHKSDLLLTIDAFCNQHSIHSATFSVTGAVLSATIGVYDQNQQVYISSNENKQFDILSCIGNVSQKDNRLFANARIILSDDHGKIIGGRLFSQTIVFTGELELRELIGSPFKRDYNKTTGLFLWKSFE